MKARFLAIMLILGGIFAAFVGGIIYLLTKPTPNNSQINQNNPNLSASMLPLSGNSQNQDIPKSDIKPFSGKINILIPNRFKSASLHKFFRQFQSQQVQINIKYTTGSLKQNYASGNWDIVLLPSTLLSQNQQDLVKFPLGDNLKRLFFYPVQQSLSQQNYLIPFALDMPVLYVSPYLQQYYNFDKINSSTLKEISLITYKTDDKGKISNYPILLGWDYPTKILLKRLSFDLFGGYEVWLATILQSFEKVSQNNLKELLAQNIYTHRSYNSLKKEKKICQRVMKIDDLRICLLKRKKTFIVPGWISEQNQLSKASNQIKMIPLTDNDISYPIILRGWGIHQTKDKSKLKYIEKIFEQYFADGSSQYGWRPHSLSAFEKTIIYQQNKAQYRALYPIRDLMEFQPQNIQQIKDFLNRL